ncbi:MAG: Eco57I restriction-modification methylase domain-containing protein, partial [Muribaculaceae bacterium]
MAQLYSKEQLREIFQSPFSDEAWKAILHNLFRAEMIRKQPEKFTAEDDKEDGYFLGSLDTSDRYSIGLFKFEIKTGSVAHKKVGLRNLVKQFVNPTWGEFDAAIVVFDDKKEWRLSFVCDIKDVKTTPKRYTFVFGEHDNFYRTAIERFLTIQNSEPTFENIRKAFSVDALSDDFFDTYREYYADFVQYITGKCYVKEGNKWVERELGKPNFQYTTTFDCDDKLVRDYVKKMFGRIVFLYFLQRKGWLNGDRQYMHNLFYDSTAKDNFLDGVLEPLFFEVLNTDKQYRTADANALPGSENIPYLNGGLFARDEIDELDCVFPEDYFKKLFDFLDSYNFTIDENDVDDAEIGIDPEMLGRIFENLLEDNKDKGAFYTPKEIVNYMCRESLIAYLQNGVPERSHELIRNFVENCDASQLNAEQNKYLRKKLQDVKICDPAIGSGAFPMGLVNILSRLYIAMKADTDTSKMKRHIIENNIYGVDIEKGAVDIARLRFWLAMIVEEKEPMPLPNLHFKIMQGNSLLENYNGIPLADLTEPEVKNEPGTLDFDYDTTEQKDLVASLSLYYSTSDHNKRDILFDGIIKNVRRQISYKDINLPSGFDPSANDKFFLWHTWFKDVFDKGGFDIIIGNPPYIKEYT